MAAATLVGGTQAGNLNTLKIHSVAHWVAGEVIEETRLGGGELAPGRRQGRMHMGHQIWFWELSINATDVPEILRLDVEVYADRERSRRVLEMTGFAERRT